MAINSQVVGVFANGLKSFISTMHWDRDWRVNRHFCVSDPFCYYKYPRRVYEHFHPLIDFDWDYSSSCYVECHRCDYESIWCHRSCLTGTIYIETGDEKDSCGKGTYKIIFDAHHFRGNELQLKAKNNDFLILEGQQKDDRVNKIPTACITKSFVRKFKLPRNYDAALARATFSKDGILTIIVPAPPPLDDVEREIEILETDRYYGATGNADNDIADMKAIENEKEEDKQDEQEEQEDK
uniref:SHSP domain-containing protein n=1 Tax=Glossina pallidipes TaxID=7398 RepID=A0A1B0AJS3_GLOPL